QIAKATAFLLLNELGSTASSKRQEKFDTLVEIFSYPIYRSAQQNLNLDIQQIEALKRGETVVEWTKQFGRTTAMNVYAPWGKTNDILVLDGIKMFDPYPVNIIASFIIISLLLIATSIMFIVGNLTRQLHSLQEKVDAISPEDNKQKSTIVSTNAINQLNEKIFAMANRIEKLLNEKAYMIRAVSHDLRTPIAKIHFRLEALTMIVGEDNTALQGCKDDLKQLNVLIDELLTYEKLVQTPTVNFSDIQLSKLIKKQIDSSLILHPEIAINILDSTNGEFYIEGHKGLLLRLFDNILNNASRYAKSKIRVSIEQESQQLSITIDDDGTGLDKNTIDHLFEPFFRTDSSRNSELGGYGMGLAIVKQIAKQHNVKITVANNEWYGASFVLHFPIKTTNIQMKRK
ncbi:MAG: ATP-binding protein, partial [Thalassotalea sp.]|nr:ATP-binding protein [Thalassotalea sp.]